MIPGSTYHLYNHANGRENLFVETKNYYFFLEKLSFHVLPVAEIYAYCLMPNHFHMLIKIRNQKELIEYFSRKNEATEGTTLPATFDEQLLVKKISKAFSNQPFQQLYSGV